MTAFQLFIIGAFQTVLTGVILLAIRSWNKKNEKREEMRKEGDVLVLQNIDAIGTLADRSARCIKGEKVNGELDAAMEHRTNMKHALETHLMKVKVDAKC
jgi:hypothetical protein